MRKCWRRAALLGDSAYISALRSTANQRLSHLRPRGTCRPHALASGQTGYLSHEAASVAVKPTSAMPSALDAVRSAQLEMETQFHATRYTRTGVVC
jgi:hypothetical protein